MAKKKVSKKTGGGLSDRALLVSVNISQWSARKVDRKATLTAHTVHKASDLAGAYNKKLLPGAVELEAVTTIVSQVRKYFHSQTLPWMADGARILSSKNYIDFAAELRRMKDEFDGAVKDFAAAYPRLEQEAKVKLGDLYDSMEYPSPYEIEDKFSITVNYLPLPDEKDFRIELSDTEKKDFVKKMKEVEGAAMQECWDRLHGVVKTAVDRLSQPHSTFRDSLLENINEICALLPKLNVSDDKNLEKMRREVMSLVGELNPDVLRDDLEEKDKASKALSDIESKMGAFMGVRK